MRFLTILRHANAEPATPGGTDFDRVLSERGRRQCEQLHEWARSDALGAYGPVTALVSAAARTRETFARSFEGTPFVVSVNYSELIYNGRRDVSGEDVLIDLAAIDPVTTSLLVVGHNPTVWELGLSLTKNPPDTLLKKYPTAGALVLALPENEHVGLAHYECVDWKVPD